MPRATDMPKDATPLPFVMENIVAAKRFPSLVLDPTMIGALLNLPHRSEPEAPAYRASMSAYARAFDIRAYTCRTLGEYTPAALQSDCTLKENWQVRVSNMGLN